MESMTTTTSMTSSLRGATPGCPASRFLAFTQLHEVSQSVATQGSCVVPMIPATAGVYGPAAAARAAAVVPATPTAAAMSVLDASVKQDERRWTARNRTFGFHSWSPPV